MNHLREIQLRDGETRPSDFPFDLPVIKNWQPLTLESPVTILVGRKRFRQIHCDRGDRLCCRSNYHWQWAAHRDPSLAHVHTLAKWLKLIWNKRVRKGFFLRAEDFFGFVKRQAQTKIEMQRELDRVENEYQGRSKQAQGLARMPFANELGAMQNRYGDGLDTQSHGESFLALFQARFVPGGLYLLDEPEAPLSPLRQMALMS